jgi:hypothetical protein
MRKFVLTNWPIIVTLLLSFLITWPVFVSGYFSHHDDLQVMRIFEMRKCFSDLQIPCRWVPDMGYGNGVPLFNFYGPFAYYLGAIASFVLGFIGAAKFLFFLPLVLGGIGMYLLTGKLFGKIPGVIGGVLYLFAPYRALDAYVRGAVGESFALAAIPFVFYFFFLLIKSKEKKYFLWASISTAIFMTSHNIMTLLFTPLIIVWIILWLYKTNWKNIKVTFLSLIIAFGLSAFFILPAYFEKGLIQTTGLTTGELNFRAQYVKVSQLFLDRSWHYGASSPQKDDTISYQIGWPHWWLAVLALGIFAVGRKSKDKLLSLFLLVVFAVGVGMTHNKSAPVWESIKLLTFVQFPWRFLSLAIFSASVLGALFVSKLPTKWLKITTIMITLLTIALNYQYFRPEHFYKGVTDEVKLGGTNFLEQQRGALLDYLPLTALEPRELAPKIENFENKTNSWKLNVKVDKETAVEVPVFDFPGWVTNYPHRVGETGRIVVDLLPGEHEVIGRFGNTPIRTLGNLLSLVSLVSLGLIYAKSRKIFD